MSVVPLSSSTVVAGGYASGRAQMRGTAPQAATGTVIVKLSGTALAKSLKSQGLTPSQIAVMMGSDQKTVDDYLGITPTPTAFLYNSAGTTSAL